MSESTPTFDPKFLQAKWLLGDIAPEELVAEAIVALEHGFSGSALQQLAGLASPARRDLGSLPDRAFAEIGLAAMDKSQAARYVVAHYSPANRLVVTKLLESFPAFEIRWNHFVAEQGVFGPFTDTAQFVEFVVEDLYDKGDTAEVRRAFDFLESLLVGADEETTNLVALGFFETLQCVASWRPYGNRAFEPFLGQLSRQIWEELRVMWRGKSSLAQVIRAERQRSEEK